MVFRAFGFLSIVLAVIALTSCGPTPNLVAHPTTQSTTLRSSLKGNLITISDEQAIIGYSLPDAIQTTVRPAVSRADSRFLSIYTVAGPDVAGQIAFVEGQMQPGRHRLKVINRDGTNERQLFERPGDPTWDGVISKQISLSRRGEVALIADMHGIQFTGAYLQEGMLQLCNVDNGAVRTVTAALDQGLYWFPNSEQLAFVAATPISAIPNAEKQYRWMLHDPDRTLAVLILDVTTGQSRVIAAGTSPVVADDGKSVLVQGDGVMQRIDLATGIAVPVTVPYGGTIIALAADGTAIYEGTQTEAPPTFTKYYSPLVGSRELASIKVGILNTSQYQTLIPSFDFRNAITFGP